MHIGNQQKTTELLYKYHSVLYLIATCLQKVTLSRLKLDKQTHVYTNIFDKKPIPKFMPWCTI